MVDSYCASSSVDFSRSVLSLKGCPGVSLSYSPLAKVSRLKAKLGLREYAGVGISISPVYYISGAIN